MGAVIYEADDAPSLAEILKVRQPRLMLLDWELPGLNRGPPLPGLRDIYPIMRVIALDNRPRSESAASGSGWMVLSAAAARRRSCWPPSTGQWLD